MNANELADLMILFDSGRIYEHSVEIADMLRQQQAEIEALKAKYEPQPLTKEQEQAVLAVWKQIQPHLFKEDK